MVEENEFISEINIRLDTIAILNSFVNDGKTYYIVLLEKNEDNITRTLREHFQVKNWTFDLQKISSDWKELLKQELLGYFGQYILQAKSPFIRSEYEGKKNEDFDSISRRIILTSDTNCEFLLDTFLQNIQKLVGESFNFYRLKVNWDTPNGYEVWYECYENDYLFDLGKRVLFLHFGGSD